MSATRETLLRNAGLLDLAEPSRDRAPIARADLERVLAARNPLAAAALADARREATSALVVTTPWTLRARAPGVPFTREDPTRVSHALDAAGGIDADELQLLGEFPPDMGLAHAIELVRSAVAARGDLPLRAFMADEVAAVVRRERMPARDVLGALHSAGLATLDWRPGADAGAEALRVHRAAHEAGLRTVAPLAYSRGGIGKPLLDRLGSLRDVAESTGGFLSVVLLPDRTEGASPLDGTAGTEDTLACALARLALGHVVPHVTVDAHVLGHKLGGILLSCGADDFVGAQAAAKWAPPTDDGPRPLNPDRVRKYVIEARRSPVRRDALFRVSAPPAPAPETG